MCCPTRPPSIQSGPWRRPRARSGDFYSDLILRSVRSTRLEGWPQTPSARPRPSRLAQAGEHLRMRAADITADSISLTHVFAMAGHSRPKDGVASLAYAGHPRLVLLKSDEARRGCPAIRAFTRACDALW